MQVFFVTLAGAPRENNHPGTLDEQADKSLPASGLSRRASRRVAVLRRVIRANGLCVASRAAEPSKNVRGVAETVGSVAVRGGLVLAVVALVSSCAFPSRASRRTTGPQSRSSRRSESSLADSSGRGPSKVVVASWYGPGFNGRRTANGEVFNQNEMSAASRTLPLGSRVLITNLANGRSVVVRINDRGPYVGRRQIDLSKRAAQSLGIIRYGTARVRVTVLRSGPGYGRSASAARWTPLNSTMGNPSQGSPLASITASGRGRTEP
jgi:rare lipoprotein A